MADLPAWATKGREVVCVKGGVTLNNLGLRSPEVGSVYTIERAFILAQSSHPAMVRDEPVVIVAEHPKVVNSVSCFRPATGHKRLKHRKAPRPATTTKVSVDA
jgi:hypothetical protein